MGLLFKSQRHVLPKSYLSSPPGVQLDHTSSRVWSSGALLCLCYCSQYYKNKMSTKVSNFVFKIIHVIEKCAKPCNRHTRGGAGKARFNVATPTNATVTCTAYVLPYNLQTKSI